jgi:hypothetical protein
MILYLNDSINSTKKFLYIKITFSKVVGHKINIQKSAVFVYTNNEQIETKIRTIIPFVISSKNKIPKYKFNEGSERPLQQKL